MNDNKSNKHNGAVLGDRGRSELKLYEISAAQRQFFDAVTDLHGELTPELEEAGNRIKSDLKEKVHDCIAYYKSLEYELNAFELEIARLNVLKGIHEQRLESFERYLLRCLGPETKIETSIGRLSFRESKATEVYDVDAVPVDYWVYPHPVARIDKTRILREGKPIPGVKITPNYSLQIK